MKKTASYLLIIMFLVSCSTLQFQKNQAQTEILVKAATSRVLVEKPEWAESVFNITDSAINALESDEVIGLKELEIYIRKQIPWQSLTPEERILMDVLIVAIRMEIDGAVKKKDIPEDIKVQLTAVLQWINYVAQVYKGEIIK